MGAERVWHDLLLANPGWFVMPTCLSIVVSNYLLSDQYSVGTSIKLICLTFLESTFLFLGKPGCLLTSFCPSLVFPDLSRIAISGSGNISTSSSRSFKDNFFMLADKLI